MGFSAGSGCDKANGGVEVEARSRPWAGDGGRAHRVHEGVVRRRPPVHRSGSRDALLAAGVDERHLHQDRASGARDDRPGLKACLGGLREGDTLVVWKLDRLGRSLPHLLGIVGDLRERGVAFRSLTERMDTASPQGELLFDVFGALAQYERALIRERVMAGLRAAEAWGRRGGRPCAISDETLAAIRAALEGGMSKAAACRTFGVRRTTLIEALRRSG